MMTFVVRGASTAQQSQAPPARRPALRSEQGPRQRQERTGDSRQVCNLCERQRQGRSPLAGLTRPPGPLVAPAVSARVVTLLTWAASRLADRLWPPAWQQTSTYSGPARSSPNDLGRKRREGVDRGGHLADRLASSEADRLGREACVHSREACVQGPERQVCTGWTTSSCPAHGPCECPHDNACGWRWGGPHRRTFIPNRGTSSRGPDTTYHGVCIFWLVGPFYFWLGPYLLLAGGVLLLAGAFLRRGPLRGLWGFSGPLLLLGRKLAVC